MVYSTRARKLNVEVQYLERTAHYTLDILSDSSSLALGDVLVEYEADTMLGKV